MLFQALPRGSGKGQGECPACAPVTWDGQAHLLWDLHKLDLKLLLDGQRRVLHLSHDGTTSLLHCGGITVRRISTGRRLEINKSAEPVMIMRG